MLMRKTSMIQVEVPPRGFTLIELMLSLAIGMIILAGILSIAIRVALAAGDLVQETRLSQQLRLTLDKISQEIQRAGYIDWYVAWDKCITQTVPGKQYQKRNDSAIDVADLYACAAPAMSLFGSIRAFRFPLPGTAASGKAVACVKNCDCLLYSYDFNRDGIQGVGTGSAGPLQNNANFELFGFRWNDGAIEMRTSGSDHSCNTGGWRDINDTNVTIAYLSFNPDYLENSGKGADSATIQYTGEGNWSREFQGGCIAQDTSGEDALPQLTDVLCLSSRFLEVEINGYLTADPASNLALAGTVKNRNDYLAISPP